MQKKLFANMFNLQNLDGVFQFIWVSPANRLICMSLVWIAEFVNKPRQTRNIGDRAANSQYDGQILW